MHLPRFLEAEMQLRSPGLRCERALDSKSDRHSLVLLAVWIFFFSFVAVLVDDPTVQTVETTTNLYWKELRRDTLSTAVTTNTRRADIEVAL